MSDVKTRTLPAAVTLTPRAEARIAELMASAPEGAIGVKLSTPRRGCSGLAYSVDYVTEETRFDEKIATPGGMFGTCRLDGTHNSGNNLPVRPMVLNNRRIGYRRF